MTPTTYKPNLPEDFIGDASIIAKMVLTKAEAYRSTGDGNYRLLLYGHPGTGKSRLAMLTALLLAGHPLGVEHVNGQSCNIETIRKWREGSAYRPLYGQRIVKLIDECDAMSEAALNEYRTLSDTLPPCCDIIMTTNKLLAELQPQLQSRAFAHRFKPCNAVPLGHWLTERFGIEGNEALRIAQANRGDIRASLFDAEAWLDRKRMEAA
jgi:DNA polymerase III delta prime subunit